MKPPSPCFPPADVLQSLQETMRSHAIRIDWHHSDWRSSCTLRWGSRDLPAPSYDRMSAVNKPNCKDPSQADTDGLPKMSIVGIRGQCSATSLPHSRRRGSPFLWEIERSLDLWLLRFASRAIIFPFPVVSCIQRNWWECILFCPGESCFYQTRTGKREENAGLLSWFSACSVHFGLGEN